MLNKIFSYNLGRLRLAFICVVAWWLAACASPEQAPGSWSQGGAFERTGRFSVSSQEPDGTQEAVQGGFLWHDAKHQLTLTLNNPMGTTLARVLVYSDYAVLERTNGTQETASSANSLVAQTLGLPLPVANLRYWIQGQTGPGTVSGMRTNSNSTPEQFSQHGWQVSLSRYDALGPTLIQLKRHDHQRRINVRLAITQ